MADPESFSPMPPGKRLSRRGLTILLLIVAATPVVAVGYLWNTLPRVQQHPLQVTLEEVDAVAPSGAHQAGGNGSAVSAADAASRRLRFRNDSDETWSSVAVTLNERFFFHRPGTVEPGETVELYLVQFALRSGIRFDPATIDVRSVEIYARLPSGARGLFAAKAPFDIGGSQPGQER